MKIINDLIVLSVPKGATDFMAICPPGEDAILQYLNGLSCGVIPLPPGQYEIIGLYSEVTRKMMREILHYAKFIWIDLLSSEFSEFLQSNQLQPTDTTDLLFIHKLK